jgi:hypothetical protein
VLVFRFVVACCVLLLVTGLGVTASAAAGVSFGKHDLRSVFYVAKSENQNQVHYGLRLDAECRPHKKAPVFAYWRRYRETGRVDAVLEGPGVRVYGASDEQKVQAGTTGGTVDMYVKALPRVRIHVKVEKTADGCKATPLVTLQKQRAKLSHAFLQLGRWGLMVKYVEVVGTREADGKRISEKFD